MTAFDRFDRVSDRVQGAIFGTTFEHRPQSRPVGDRDARPIADPGRAVATFTGILTTHPTTQNLADNYDPRTDRRPGVSAPIDTIEVPAEAGLRIEEGDIFVRLSDGARWLVANTADDDAGRTKAQVNRLKP